MGPSEKAKQSETASEDRKGQGKDDQEKEEEEERPETIGAPGPSGVKKQSGTDGPQGTDDKPQGDKKDDDGASKKPRRQPKAPQPRPPQAESSGLSARVRREYGNLGGEGIFFLQRLYEMKCAGGRGSPDQLFAESVAELQEVDSHVCPSCESTGVVGRFECAMSSIGFKCPTTSKTLYELESVYQAMTEQMRPLERRFLDLVVAKINKEGVPGFWLPGDGIGITHDDWMNVGDNRMRTGGGGQAARLARLAEVRNIRATERLAKHAKKYESPPFTVEYINNKRGYAWIANRFIPRGEPFWRETVYHFKEPRHDDGEPDDWEGQMKELLSCMTDTERRYFMVLPQDVRELDSLSGKKMDKPTRIFRRWSIGCEGIDTGIVSKVYGAGVAFLNHSCIPNAQQAIGEDRVIPTDIDKHLDRVEEMLRAANIGFEGEGKGKEKEKAGSQDEKGKGKGKGEENEEEKEEEKEEEQGEEQEEGKGEEKEKGKGKEKEKETEEKIEDRVHSRRKNILNLLEQKGRQASDAREKKMLEEVYRLESAAAKTHLVVYIQAVKDIQPGTEITIQYLNFLMDKSSRNEMLVTTFGFTCYCDTCQSPMYKMQDLALRAIDDSLNTRTVKTVRRRPVRNIQEATAALWTMANLGIWDIRLARLTEVTGDILVHHEDKGRAFFFYMMAERLFMMTVTDENEEYLRAREKTNTMFRVRAKSKRGASTVEDSLLLYLNEEYLCEMLTLLGCEDGKFRRLPQYRKKHPWLKWFDREKYIHERTQMELDLVAEWTAGWMEDRIDYVYKHGAMKGERKIKRRRKKKNREGLLPVTEKRSKEKGEEKGEKKGEDKKEKEKEEKETKDDRKEES